MLFSYLETAGHIGIGFEMCMRDWSDVPGLTPSLLVNPMVFRVSSLPETRPYLHLSGPGPMTSNLPRALKSWAQTSPNTQEGSAVISKDHPSLCGFSSLLWPEELTCLAFPRPSVASPPLRIFWTPSTFDGAWKTSQGSELEWSQCWYYLNILCLTVPALLHVLLKQLCYIYGLPVLKNELSIFGLLRSEEKEHWIP